MRPKLIILFLVIVFVPLAVVGWLGVRIARDEQEMVQHRLQKLFTERLRDVDTAIAQWVAERERALMAGPPLSSLLPDALRQRAQESGAVRQFFVLDAKGGLVYPSLAGPLNRAEQEFLERTRQVWLNGEIPVSRAEIAAPVAQAFAQAAATSRDASPSQGWHVWHWGAGIGLIFWWRDALGVTVGAELNAVRFTADIVGLLPDTRPADLAAAEGRTALVDANGAVVYQWGGYQPGKGEPAQASLALRPPLGAWKLEYFAPNALDGAGYGGTVLFNLLSGLGALAVAILVLAAYFYWLYAREMREAAQRVSFVNQVSHELRTPLTNIRMYADMLGETLGETDADARRHLNIIVSEGERLSRLIGNVLTFSRKQRSVLKLHPTPGQVDVALRHVLDQFREPLKSKGIELAFSAGAGQEAAFDEDALQQIVGNLLSNI